ncbi:MAG TPA: arginase family protein [Solirubrobacteraceae bacterium]|nr:arginase family protein [Solirubrobacteraceae bacterium]
MPELQPIALPFHNGAPDAGMAAGVTAVAEALGLRPDVVPPVDPALPEVRRSIELDLRLAERVRAAAAGGAFPLVLAGNCNSCLGAVGGVGSQGLGVVWFDAHADFDTPEDNVSGFFDVMALSTLTGSAWQAQRARITDPVAEEDVVLAGVRDLEPYQRERLARSRLRVVHGALDGLEAALDALPTPRVYLHLDLDALDAGEGAANGYAAAGGPTLTRYLDAVDAVFDRFAVAAAALTSYDPATDADGRALRAACALVERVVERVCAAA